MSGLRRGLLDAVLGLAELDGGGLELWGLDLQGVCFEVLVLEVFEMGGEVELEVLAEGLGRVWDGLVEIFCGVPACLLLLGDGDSCVIDDEFWLLLLFPFLLLFRLLFLRQSQVLDFNLGLHRSVPLKRLRPIFVNTSSGPIIALVLNASIPKVNLCSRDLVFPFFSGKKDRLLYLLRNFHLNLL